MYFLVMSALFFSRRHPSGQQDVTSFVGRTTPTVENRLEQKWKEYFGGKLHLTRHLKYFSPLQTSNNLRLHLFFKIL